MTPLIDGELLIERHPTHSEVIRLDWKGRSSARRPDEALNPFLDDVLAQALQAAARIEMHFEGLDYLNSSTIAVLVGFLHRARMDRVPLHFVYRPSVRWQKLSFDALRVFEQIDSLIRVVPVA